MNNMPKPLKYSLFLLALGLITGFMLAFINSITEPIIDKRKEDEAREALQDYFDYEKYEDVTSEFVNNQKGIDKIYLAFNSDKLVAVIYQTTFLGYGGDVTSLVGIDATNDKFINVYAIDASQETKNIGSKIIGHDFDIKNENIKSYTFEIIVGATYSSNAVKSGVEASKINYEANKTEWASR